MRERWGANTVEPTPGMTGTPSRKSIAVTIWDFFVWFFWFYIAVSCIWIFITVIIDVFRSSDLNGWQKALWVIFLVVLPFLAAFIYLIARGKKMGQRAARDSQEIRSQQDDYIRSVASSGSTTSEIESAKRLLDAGTITQAEFDQIKAKALASV